MMSIEFEKPTEEQFTPAVESRMRLAVFVQTLMLPEFSIKEVLYKLTNDYAFKRSVLRVLQEYQSDLVADLLDKAGFEEEE